MPPPKASDDDGGGGEGGSGAPVAPAWARDLADRNALVRGAEIAAHAADGGGHSGGDAAPSLKEE